MKDPLAVTRGLAVTDRALLNAGLDEDERLAVWRSSVRAVVGLATESGVIAVPCSATTLLNGVTRAGASSTAVTVKCWLTCVMPPCPSSTS